MRNEWERIREEKQSRQSEKRGKGKTKTIGTYNSGGGNRKRRGSKGGKRITYERRIAKKKKRRERKRKATKGEYGRSYFNLCSRYKKGTNAPRLHMLLL